MSNGEVFIGRDIQEEERWQLYLQECNDFKNVKTIPNQSWF